MHPIPRQINRLDARSILDTHYLYRDAALEIYIETPRSRSRAVNIPVIPELASFVRNVNSSFVSSTSPIRRRIPIPRASMNESR